MVIVNKLKIESFTVFDQSEFGFGVSRFESASSLSDIKTILALDEGLQQSDRYLNMVKTK